MSELSSNNLRKPPATILVVEAAVLVRMVIADYLRHCEYKVIEAGSSDEAVAILNEGGIAIDVVFTEVELPGSLDGFGLARWIRANKPLTKVLLVGTLARAADVAADLCEDGPLMSKPYDKQIVVDRIKRLLASVINDKQHS